MRRLRWWLFLLRYRIARWRGKVWATGMVRPEFLFASREGKDRVTIIARIESTDAPAAPTDYGYFKADQPKCRIWEDPHA